MKKIEFAKFQDIYFCGWKAFSADEIKSAAIITLGLFFVFSFISIAYAIQKAPAVLKLLLG